MTEEQESRDHWTDWPTWLDPPDIVKERYERWIHKGRFRTKEEIADDPHYAVTWDMAIGVAKLHGRCLREVENIVSLPEWQM